jgi:16S rRNA A1518/A1519 N6-dimethyltransferase RsmA/KsgA/DIM1 with predicted DNA glycosylase/AP lyase activity
MIYNIINNSILLNKKIFKLLADTVAPEVNLKLFHSDALTFPMGQHVNKEKYYVDWNSDELPNAALIGNLPFNIATPLLFKLLLKVSDKNSVFSLGRVPITFLFQQEFGERMICPTGFNERSRVSVHYIILNF